MCVCSWVEIAGNGTEAHFYGSNEVLFMSLHQDKLYPLDTGGVERVGEGAGLGYNLNIPLPPGSGWGAYKAAFKRIILPALHAFKPDLILVSSGFDCAFLDPLGRMMLTSENFASMTKYLMEAAAELCHGRLVIAHEGGYSELYVPYCGLAVLEALTGVKSGIHDPFIADVGSPEWQALQAHQDAAIAAAEANLKLALVVPPVPLDGSAASGLSLL